VKDHSVGLNVICFIIYAKIAFNSIREK